jgi:hypothetical protein
MHAECSCAPRCFTLQPEAAELQAMFLLHFVLVASWHQLCLNSMIILASPCYRRRFKFLCTFITHRAQPFCCASHTFLLCHCHAEPHLSSDRAASMRYILVTRVLRAVLHGTSHHCCSHSTQNFNGYNSVLTLTQPAPNDPRTTSLRGKIPCKYLQECSSTASAVRTNQSPSYVELHHSRANGNH